jgi:glucosylceramidase
MHFNYLGLLTSAGALSLTAACSEAPAPLLPEGLGSGAPESSQTSSASPSPAATTGTGMGTPSSTLPNPTSGNSATGAPASGNGSGTAPPSASLTPEASASSPSVTPQPSQPTDSPPTPSVPETSTPGPVAERPSLVTSGENAYWQVAQLQETTGNPAATVDTTTRYQTWLGFGGSFNEAGWDALGVASTADRERAIKLLFSKTEGAGLNWGRVPIGASDYALSRYTLDDLPEGVTSDPSMMYFSIARDQQLLIPYIQAALAINPDIHLWASPWSPPAWMKSTGKLDGTSKLANGGTSDNLPDAQMSSDVSVLQAYALYLARFVEEYATLGLTIESVMPQNEPGYATRYPSCLWTPELMRDFVRDYLGPTFVQRGLSAEIWLGTMSNNNTDGNILSAVTADAAALAYVKGFGLQWNMISSVAGLKQHDLPILQTEHKCGNYPFTVEGAPPFNKDKPPNDHAYGEESWGLLVQWIKEGVHSYSAWNMVLDTVGKNLDFDRPWPQNALLTVDRDSQVLNVTPAYYAFRHLASFVDPGATRVAINGAEDALAFENPDGSLVAILHNGTGQVTPMTLGIAGKVVQFQVPARGWASVHSK